MEEKSKLAYVFSLHFAIFAAGASSNGSISASFVFGAVSLVVLVLTTLYEIIFVSTRRKYQEEPKGKQTPTAD
jgi:TRAP-type C4-dicarboxylate transport system permease large subunit